MDLLKLINNQREYFNSGQSRDVKLRIQQLKKVKVVFEKYENECLLALAKDCLFDCDLLEFKSSKSSFRINTSPLTSIKSGKEIISSLKIKGIPLMVYRLDVISSPVLPSPRVEPLINYPYS